MLWIAYGKRIYRQQSRFRVNEQSGNERLLDVKRILELANKAYSLYLRGNLRNRLDYSEKYF